MFFERDNVTLMVREDDLDETVRPPIGANEANKILEHIRTWKGKVSKQWKARSNAHQKKLEDGKPLSYAEVYKGLRKLKEDGSLSASDRTHLKQTERFLAEEMANALGKTYRETRKQMKRATQS